MEQCCVAKRFRCLSTECVKTAVCFRCLRSSLSSLVQFLRVLSIASNSKNSKNNCKMCLGRRVDRNNANNGNEDDRNDEDHLDAEVAPDDDVDRDALIICTDQVYAASGYSQDEAKRLTRSQSVHLPTLIAATDYLKGRRSYNQYKRDLDGGPEADARSMRDIAGWLVINDMAPYAWDAWIILNIVKSVVYGMALEHEEFLEIRARFEEEGRIPVLDAVGKMPADFPNYLL